MVVRGVKNSGVGSRTQWWGVENSGGEWKIVVWGVEK